MNNRISVVILAACISFTHWRANATDESGLIGFFSVPLCSDQCANATDESGLIGLWQTADDSSFYNFEKDHSVTKAWYPKDPSVKETYSNIVPLASMTGHWKLDGEQLVITMDSEFVPESSGKVTTVHLSGKQGNTTWTIVSVSDSTMKWRATPSDDCVSRSIELKLRHIGHPQLFAMNGR